MVKIGLIGAGFMGGTHAAAYEELQAFGKVQVTAVADLIPERAEKLAARLGAKVYSSGDELLKNADINTADICLPTYLHYDFAVKAIEKGYNAFVEKPLCLTYAQADELARLAEQKGVTTMVGQCIRFWDEYVYLKKLYDSKTYGAPVNAAFKRLSPRPGWGWEGWILDSQRSGGAALDLHVHDSDFMLYIFGVPKTVNTIINKKGEKNSYILSIFEYDGFVVSAEGTWDLPSCYPFEMSYRAVFENAAVEFSSVHGLKIYTEQGSFTPELKKRAAAGNEDFGGNITQKGAYYNELKYFTDCLFEGKKATAADFRQGAEAIKLIEREKAACGIK